MDLSPELRAGRVFSPRSSKLHVRPLVFWTDSHLCCRIHNHRLGKEEESSIKINHINKHFKLARKDIKMSNVYYLELN